MRPVAAEAVVRMYSRRTCGLCDEARKVIEAMLARHPFRFEEVFIDGDDSLEREYGLRVPVVEVNGAEQFEFSVDPAALEGMVAAGTP
jgi:glutaredoxin